MLSIKRELAVQDLQQRFQLSIDGRAADLALEDEGPASQSGYLCVPHAERGFGTNNRRGKWECAGWRF
jgi:hypothetical protein